MVQSKASILVKNTKWIYIAKFFSQLFAFLSTILVIRQLAVSVFGTFNLLLSTFVVFQIIALSAVQNVFNRYIPELVANKEYHKFNKLIGGGLGLSFFLFTILIGLLYVLRGPFASFFNINGFDKYLSAFIIFNYVHFLQIAVGAILRALLLHKQVALITVFTSAFKLALYLYFLEALNVSLLLYIEAVLGLIFVLVSGYFYINHINSFDYSELRKVATPVTSKRVRRYGLLSMANELGVGLIGKTSDYFIVAALSSSYQVGLYAFANRLYSMVFKVLPFQDFMTVVRPLFFQKFTRDYDITEFRNMYAFMIKLLLPLYVFPVLYFFFFGKSIINVVFDSRYIDAYWIILVILSSNIFLAFFFPLTLTAQLKERMDILLYSKIIAAFSILAGIYGMKLFGIMGVAMASLIGNILKNTFILFMMRGYREIKYRLSDYKNFLPMILFLVPFVFLQNKLLSSWILFLTTILFIIYVGVILLIHHPFTQYDIILLKKIASSNPILEKAGKYFRITNNKLYNFFHS